MRIVLPQATCFLLHANASAAVSAHVSGLEPWTICLGAHSTFIFCRQVNV